MFKKNILALLATAFFIFLATSIAAQKDSVKTTILKEVTVQSKKPIIKQEIDRIIYNVQADPESGSKNTISILKKIPFVSVDASENLLLKGNSSYQILLNGKPSGIIEKDPKNFLRNLPASSVQKIEVITTPPAKYDAEGLAGIINIITVKKIAEGYAGDINFNQSFPTGGPGIGANINIKKQKWGISGFAGINKNIIPSTIFDNNQISSNLIVQQIGNKSSNQSSGYFGTSFSYEIDSIHLLSIQFSKNKSNSDGLENQISKLLNPINLVQGYTANNRNDGTGDGNDFSFDYQLGFKKNKQQLLTFSFRNSAFSNSKANQINYQQKLNFSEPDFYQDNQSSASENTAQIDFVTPIKKINFETGLKAILRKNNSDFSVYNLVNNNLVKDPSKSDLYTNTQNVYSFYQSARFGIKDWSFQTGLRLEYTSVNANFITNALIVNQQYLNIIPTINIQKKLTEISSLNAGFSQRIKRPGINRLNPFVDRSNPAFEITGNPSLQAVLNNSVNMGYSRNGKVTLMFSIDYSFSKNIDLKVTRLNTSTGITRTTYENTGKASRIGLDFSLGYPITPNLNFGLNGNIAKFNIEGMVNNVLINNDLFTYYVDISIGYKLESGWQFNANMNANSKNPSGLQSVINEIIASSVSVSKDLIKNKLGFSAYLNNPFTKFRDNIEKLQGADFNQQNIAQNYFRMYGFSVNYRFGKLKESIPKNRRSIRNDDLSN
ncbi:MAG: outer membrane beta-barrel protein [Sphingobacteriia bacterium]